METYIGTLDRVLELLALNTEQRKPSWRCWLEYWNYGKYEILKSWAHVHITPATTIRFCFIYTVDVDWNRYIVARLYINVGNIEKS